LAFPVEEACGARPLAFPVEEACGARPLAFPVEEAGGARPLAFPVEEAGQLENPEHGNTAPLTSDGGNPCDYIYFSP